MKKQYWFLQAIVLLLCSHAIAQPDKRLQPLYKALQTAANDTARVKLCNQYFNTWVTQDNELAYQIALQGQAIARSMQWPKAIAVFNSNIGTVKSNAGEYDSCIFYLQQALNVHRANNDAANAASTLNNMGGAASNIKSDYPKAARYFFEALHIADSAALPKLSCICLTNIASTYFLQQNFDKALTYAQRADSVVRANIDLPRSGEIEKLLGNLYFKKNNKVFAEKYMQEALQYFVENNNMLGEASMLGNLALLIDSNFHNIIAMRSKAAALWQQVNPHHLEALINRGNLGIAYADSAFKRSYLTGQQSDAIQYQLLRQAADNLQEAIDVANQAGELDNKSLFIGKMAEVSALRKDWENAYTYFRQYTAIQDSIFSQDSKNAIATAESERLIERKENEVRLAQLQTAQQRKAALALALGVLLLLIIGMLLYRQNLQKKRANKQLLELNTALASANEVKNTFFGILTHDLRAPVAKVANMLHLQNHHPEMMPAGASIQLADTVDSLLETMDDVLLWSKGQMQQFAPNISTHLLPQLLQQWSMPYRQLAQIQFTLSVSEGQTIATDEHFLGSILQNITNNAVKALQNTPGASIQWIASMKEGKTVIQIVDNGPGMPAEAAAVLQGKMPVASGKSGFGLHIIRDLSAVIGCSIVVESTAATGTVVTLQL